MVVPEAMPLAWLTGGAGAQHEVGRHGCPVEAVGRRCSEVSGAELSSAATDETRERAERVLQVGRRHLEGGAGHVHGGLVSGAHGGSRIEHDDAELGRSARLREWVTSGDETQ